MNDTSALKYSKDHEWVREEGDGIVTIGVTAFATNQLGDVVYVDLPEVGSAVEAGSEMGEIESTKSVSDLFSPVDGEVTEINDEVVDSPEMVNSSPFDEGWLVRVRCEQLPDDLLDEQEYRELVGE